MNTTIIIPNYNGIRYLRACLEALPGELSGGDKVIVVDNGSSDGSREWVREGCPWVKLIALGCNTGFCKAVNVGIRAADTPYVLLLNNDARILPGFVRHLEEALERLPKAFSVSARMLSMDNPRLLDGAGDLYCALGWAFARGKGKEASRFFLREGEVFSACGGAAIYRRKLTERLGGFDERHFAYLEDCDLGWRAQLMGYRNYYCPKAVALHAGSGASGSRYNEFKVRLSSRNSVYLLYKNMFLWQLALNLPFLLVGFGVKALFFFRKGLGRIYLRGCMEGIRLCRAGEGRERRRLLRQAGFRAALRIQRKLWGNTLRRFLG